MEKYLPKQRGNVKINNLRFLNAILYVAEVDGIVNVDVDLACLSSTIVKVHSDACGALKKEENKQSLRPQNFL